MIQPTVVRSTVTDVEKRLTLGAPGVLVEAMGACPLTCRTPLMAGRIASRKMLNGHYN